MSSFFRFDEDSKDFFNDSIRIAIVQFILERQTFSNEQESQDNIGIEKLLEDGVYKASYPLHDVSIMKFKISFKI